MTHPPARNGLPAPSGAEKRSGHDRRRGERRVAAMPVAVERRSGRERRFWEERRLGLRRRSIEGPAARASAGGLAQRSPERERARARRLLEEFVTMAGPADQRLVKLVRRQWPSYPLGARALLAETLTPLLEPLAEGRAVTDELRQVVENAVVDWAARL
ncbi:MAG TPA: hypothetical protein VNL18_14585 [Gemmatimonadales bacterium]|nr:hypothetical protein [Gemmatimonadales bacterium]